MEILILIIILIFISLPFYVGWYAYREGKQDGINEERNKTQ